jgi:hypothetical protein
MLPFQEASVNFALTIKVRGMPMRKIHHGFIAIAILGGPTSIILAHQKITEAFPQDASIPFRWRRNRAAGLFQMLGSAAGCQTLTMR